MAAGLGLSVVAGRLAAHADNDLERRMDANDFGIPTGPVEREPLGSRHRTREEQEAILRDALLAAGLRLGDYDDRIVTWFAEFADWGTFATITSWIQRAGDARK